MSREIKFRAWNGCDWINLDEWPLGDIPSEGIEFMQFTGLKDKNGVDIYEGDILEGRAGNYVVKFVGCCFKKQRGEMPISLDNDSSEVIGNIHENKELLEEK